MGRVKRARKEAYKPYYDRGTRNLEIPESTLRYLRRPQQEAPELAERCHGLALADNNASDQSLPTAHVIQTGNLNFTASNHTLSDVTEDHESSVESHSSDDGSESSARRDCGSADVRLQCMNQIEQSEVHNEESFHASTNDSSSTSSSTASSDANSSVEFDSGDECSDFSMQYERHEASGGGDVRNIRDEEHNRLFHVGHNKESSHASTNESSSTSSSTASSDANSSVEFDSGDECTDSSMQYERREALGGGYVRNIRDEEHDRLSHVVQVQNEENFCGSTNESSSTSSSTTSSDANSFMEFDSDIEGTDSSMQYEHREASGVGDVWNIRDEEHDILSHMGDNEPQDIEVWKDPYKRLKSSLNGSFGEDLNLTVKISVREILLNALTLARKHKWSHLEKADVMKLVNSVLNNGKVIPSSRYLLDQYFFSMEDMHYYFYCSACTQSIGNVLATKARPDNVVCSNPNCNHVNTLSDLSHASYFVTFALPPQIERLLSDPKLRSKLVNPSDFADPPPDGIMNDLYHGTMYRDFANRVKNDSSPTMHISFTMSVDSASLCTSFSGQSICPVFLMLNELPTVLRMGNLLLAGLWFGRVKEKIDLLLPPIVNHFVQLHRGFFINVGGVLNRVVVWLLGCCADSVARCEIQGIHSHRGDFPCSWCLIEGEEWQKSRIFRYTAMPNLRTVQGLLQDAEDALQTKFFVNGVKYLSPLAGAPFFDPVNGFIVDQMHAKDEGTTKSYLKAWIRDFIGDSENLKTVDARMKQLKVPKECRKSIRSLGDTAHWTGREFENWGLFVSIPVLHNIVPRRNLMHWALYVQANYLLLSTSVSLQAVDIAEKLFEEFCSKTEALYGPVMMRFNLHLLRHFADNCRRWGPLFLSAYAFEAGNQRLKEEVHNCNYVPNQVARSFSETNASNLLRTHCESAKTKLFASAIDRKAVSPLVPRGNIKLMKEGKAFRATEEEEWFFRRDGKTSSSFTQYGEVIKVISEDIRVI